MRPSFLHHLHPPTIPTAQSRWRYTLGAGGTAVFLMLILGVTGILEMFYYIPNPEVAALSIQTITYHIPFGRLIRNLHYWSAQLLLIVSAIHLLRVVFTAAYSRPRRFNYLLGLALLVFVILLDFTGYILRWDVDICYPLLTGTNLLKTIPLIGDFLHRITIGGGEACSTGLLRMYVWHIFGLTLPVIILGIWHAFRVRRDGGIAVPPPQIRTDNARISRNELVRREALAMFIVGIPLILLSSFVPAPIAPAMPESVSIRSSIQYPLSASVDNIRSSVQYPLSASVDNIRSSVQYPLSTSVDNIRSSVQYPLSASVEGARAPWFFLWIQQILKWGDPFIFGVLIPLGILLLLALIPYIFPQPADSEIGTWFPKSNRLAQITLGLVSLIVILLTLLANAN